MKKLTFAEMPKTRVEFVSRWKADNIFRCRAEVMGFNVIFENVVFPNGNVATPKVK